MLWVAVNVAACINFQHQTWETKIPPWKKFLKFSEENLPLKTCYIFEWSLISHIAQTLCALWKNFLCFLNKPSSYLSQFPAQVLKNFSYISLKKGSPTFWDGRWWSHKIKGIPYTPRWLLMKPWKKEISLTLGWLPIKPKNEKRIVKITHMWRS